MQEYQKMEQKRLIEDAHGNKKKVNIVTYLWFKQSFERNNLITCSISLNLIKL